MDKILTFRFISRLLHLLAAGYILGHLFTFFWATPMFMLAHESTSSAPHLLYLISGIIVTLTGFTGILLILYQTRPTKYHIKWEYILFAKLFLSILLTRVSDWMVFKAMGLGQLGRTIEDVSSEEIIGRYFSYVGTIKILALLAVMFLSTWAKFYREEITDNFTRKTRNIEDEDI